MTAHMVIPCIMETELDHARHMKMPADVLVSVGMMSLAKIN